MRQSIDQPALRDRLHPRAHQRDELAGEEQPVVAVAKDGEQRTAPTRPRQIWRFPVRTAARPAALRQSSARPPHGMRRACHARAAMLASAESLFEGHCHGFNRRTLRAVPAQGPFASQPHRHGADDALEIAGTNARRRCRRLLPPPRRRRRRPDPHRGHLAGASLRLQRRERAGILRRGIARAAGRMS